MDGFGIGTLAPSSSPRERDWRSRDSRMDARAKPESMVCLERWVDMARPAVQGSGGGRSYRLTNCSNPNGPDIPQVVNIDLDRVWNPIGVGIRRAYVFAGFGV